VGDFCDSRNFRKISSQLNDFSKNVTFKEKFLKKLALNPNLTYVASLLNQDSRCGCLA
jgi:hypothetical protein